MRLRCTQRLVSGIQHPCSPDSERCSCREVGLDAEVWRPDVSDRRSERSRLPAVPGPAKRIRFCTRKQIDNGEEDRDSQQTSCGNCDHHVAYPLNRNAVRGIAPSSDHCC